MKKTLCWIAVAFLIGIVSLYIGTVIHEASHVIVALAFGGKLHAVRFGYFDAAVDLSVDMAAHPYVGLAPFVLPTLLVFGLSFVKFKNPQAEMCWIVFVAFFAVGRLMECLMNIVAVFAAKTDRGMWDLCAAADTASDIGAGLCVVLVIACAVLLVFTGIRTIKKFIAHVGDIL